MVGPHAAQPPGERPYRVFFLVGGLLVEQAVTVASLFMRLGDWRAVRIVLDQNDLLHVRTQASNDRVDREVLQRLRTLTPAEVAHVATAPDPDRRHLMWAAFARQYQFVADFADHVVRDASLLGARLMATDFDQFWRAQMLRHIELRHQMPSTRSRLRANLFLALREAGLLTTKGRVVTASLSPRVTDFLSARTPSDLRFFPLGAMW